MRSFFVANGVRIDVTLTKLSGAGWPSSQAALRTAGMRPVAKNASRLSPAERVARRYLESEAPAVAGTDFDPRLMIEALRCSRRSALLLGDDAASLCLARVAAPGRRGATARPAVGAQPPRGAFMIATPTVIVEGLRRADLAAARNCGARLVHEGLEGKVLLRAPSVEDAFDLLQVLLERGVRAVAPNFLRRVVRPAVSPPMRAWAHATIGVPAAWAVTRGSRGVKVAVLDEGVDTAHAALHAAVVAERDFIGDNGLSAMPSGDDAHGTACAGVIVSRQPSCPGVSPGCSLIAARIAMGDGQDGWIFEDQATADAIDWAWNEGAAVLSNSWGGGLPSDAIRRAFERARTRGRGGKGAVVVIAAGNDQGAIDFPGNLPEYITVGASTPADERKTKTSSDCETWWGSNFGETLSVLAPGVFIQTTDITGSLGYSRSAFTRTFNGTSAATPHVAGAAALMLSANPTLSADEVKHYIERTAHRIGSRTGWTPTCGWGRLDVGSAVPAVASHSAPTRSQATARARRAR